MAGERTVRVRFVGDASSAVAAGKAAEKAAVGALTAQEKAAIAAAKAYDRQAAAQVAGAMKAEQAASRAAMKAERDSDRLLMQLEAGAKKFENVQSRMADRMIYEHQRGADAAIAASKQVESAESAAGKTSSEAGRAAKETRDAIKTGMVIATLAIRDYVRENENASETTRGLADAASGAAIAVQAFALGPMAGLVAVIGLGIKTTLDFVAADKALKEENVALSASLVLGMRTHGLFEDSLRRLGERAGLTTEQIRALSREQRIALSKANVGDDSEAARSAERADNERFQAQLELDMKFRAMRDEQVDEAQAKHKQKTDEVRKATEAVTKAQEAFNKSLGLLSVGDFTAKLGQITKAMEERKRLGITSGPVFDALTKNARELGAAADASSIPLGKLATDFPVVAADKFLKSIKFVPPALNETAKALGSIQDPAKVATRSMDDGGKANQEYAQSLYDVSGAALDAVGSLLSGGGLIDAIGQIGMAFAKGKDAGLKFGDVIGQMFGTKGSAEDGGRTSGEKFADGFGGAVSGFASNKSKGLGAQVGGGILGGLGGTFFGPMGGMIGGKIGGMIGSLFGGKPAYKKVQDDVRKNLGVALSEGTAQAIADTAKSLGVSNKLAGLLSLDKIVGEATITSGNVGKFAAQFDQLTKLAQSGAKGSAEAIKSIGAAFPALIGKFREAGMEGTKAFGDLVRSAKTMAGTVPEIAAFLKAGVAEATGALGVLFGAIRLEGAGAAKAMENLGAISTDVLTAMASLPGGARAAIDALGDGLDKIVEKAKAAGVALPAGIAGLIGQREFFKANKDLYDSVDALVTITRALGETGFISAQGFAAIQSQAATTFDQLTAAGRALPEALADMAPVLQEIINEAGRNGQVIDANTQGLIDQAAALGLVKVAGTDAFAAMRAESQYLLGGMAAIFGKEGKLKEYFAETGVAAQQTAQTVNQAWTGAATSASASWSGTAASISASHATVTTAIAGTATAVSASIATTAAATAASVAAATDNTGNAFSRLMQRIRSARFEIGDLENSVPRYAEGTDYVPRDQLAFVHKGERIVPAAENAEIMRGSSGGGTQTVGRGGGTDMTGAVMTLVAQDGAPLGKYIVTTVKRGIDERVIDAGAREF